MNETDYNLKRWTWTEEVSPASLPPNTVDDKEGSLVLFNDQDSYGGEPSKKKKPTNVNYIQQIQTQF